MQYSFVVPVGCVYKLNIECCVKPYLDSVIADAMYTAHIPPPCLVVVVDNDDDDDDVAVDLMTVKLQ